VWWICGVAVIGVWRSENCGDARVGGEKRLLYYTIFNTIAGPTIRH